MKKKFASQQGMALIAVLSIATLLLMFGAVGASLVGRSSSNTQEKFRRDAQAANIARAGLRDAIGWFKKKSAIGGAVSNPSPYDVAGGKPCADAAFSPVYHADPKLRETIDSNVGIVKDIILDESRNLYGRYIIRKQPCSTGDVLPGDPGYDKLAAHDVTKERGKGNRGEGYVWHISSEGIVYQRNSKARNSDGVFTVGPDTLPNRVLDRAYVESNINRISLRKPFAPTNIIDPYITNTAQSQFNDKCEMRGRDAQTMVMYVNGGGGQAPSGLPTCQFEVCPPPGGNTKSRTDGELHPLTVEEVFAVSKDELKAVSDYVYTTVPEIKAAHYQPAAGRMSLPLAIYYLDGDFTFSTANQLRGNGILFVNGNLTLQADSFSFSGLVYVTGTLTMADNNEIAGASLASTYDCRPSIKTSFEYNAGMLETVRDKLALYRENTLSFTSKN